jgi:hypothetical protein
MSVPPLLCCLLACLLTCLLARLLACLLAPSPRLDERCVKCPNTAWLLFLMFSIALLTLVAVSVYLSKKRLNLAALGIGMVSCLDHGYLHIQVWCANRSRGLSA